MHLKEKGYHIAAVEQVHGSIPLDQFDFSEKQPLVLVFGNEVSGVSEATLGLCDSAIEIPQSGIKHSLNIAVCAGIVLWESYVQLNSFKHRL
jgi:tRNA G18 (ribose-2'-O)-methylase SpoU